MRNDSGYRHTDMNAGDTGWSRRAPTWILAVVLFAGLVRLTNIDWDQGHFFHPDERAISDAIGRLSFDPRNPQLNPKFFAYGSLPLYITGAVSTALSWYDPALRGYDARIFLGRAVSGVVGTLTVLLLAIFGAQLYDRAVGLLAAFLLAACALHVQNSHFVTTDVFLAFVVLLALWCLIGAARRGWTRDYVYAGLSIGFAAATKFSALPLLAPLGVAILIRVYEERRLLPIAAKALVALVAVAAAFALGQPYALLDYATFWRHITEQSHMVRNAGLFPYTNQYLGVPKYFYEIEQLVLWGMAPPLGIAAVIGTGVAIARTVRDRSYPQLVLLSWVIPYFLVTGWFDVKFPRYLLPIYPLMILWAADWLLATSRRGGLIGRLAPPAVVGGTLLALLAFLAIYARPHTVITASEWAYKHIPAGSKILSQDWDEGFPFPLPGGFSGERYQIVNFGYYEPDSPSKMQKLARELSSSDYIVFQTKRLYGALTQAAQKFPLSSNYFYLLFAGDLGYTLIYEVASRPGLLGFEFPDELVDESFTVYDHPKVLIFRNDERLDEEELLARMLSSLPSRQLSRRDLLLASPGVEFGEGGSEPIRSSIPGLLTFAFLVEVLGLAAYPFLRRWLPAVSPHALAKILGVLVFAWVPWLLVSLGQAEFSRATMATTALLMMAVGAVAWWRRSPAAVDRISHSWVVPETVFWGVFFFFLAVRAFNPEIYWGEKPMDFSFLNALQRATALPPPEPWFAGHDLNYSYFGHYVTAALGKVCNLDPAITFNLGIALFAALTAVGAFALGHVISGRWRVGVMTACLTILLGNLAGPIELLDRRTMNFDYFWATSRVIRDTINEFPLWTFLFADLHAHAMVIPFSLAYLTLAVAWVYRHFRQDTEVATSRLGLLLALALTLGAIMVTNGWSSPTYALMFPFVLGCHWLGAARGRRFVTFAGQLVTKVLLPSTLLVALGYLFYLPFWLSFTPPDRNWGWETGPFARPQDFLTIFGLFLYVLVPFLFLVWRQLLQRRPEVAEEGGERPAPRLGVFRIVVLISVLLGIAGSLLVSTRSFLVILAMLALQLAIDGRTAASRRVPLALTSFAFFVTAGCEFVYVWDRMNTIFKFYLDSWLMFAAAASVAAAELWAGTSLRSLSRRAWQTGLVLLVAVAGFTAVTDTYGVLTTDRVPSPKPTLNGMLYLESRAPHELAAYRWLNQRIRGIPVILEAYGPSYQDFARVSMNTGLPTVVGWDYHVIQRSHTQADVNRRKADVKLIYTSDNQEQVRAALQRYHVALVFLGPLERRTYNGANFDLFKEWTNLLTPVYENDAVTIFAVHGIFKGAIAVTAVEQLPRVAGEVEPPPQEPEGQLHQPRGLAVDSKGAVFVCDFGNGRIQRFDRALKFELGWGDRGELPGEFRDPCGIAVGPKDMVYVADTWNHRVQVFSSKGEFVREWGAGFYGPRGIAVDTRGSVFVTDTGNNRVVRFSAKGEQERTWGSVGEEPGQFAEPVGIAVDDKGKVYVCDNANARVQIFTRDGQFVSSFPVPGWERKVYSEPYVAVDPKGAIWVTVPGEKEIRAYDGTGKLLRTIKGDTVASAKFETPIGIALSPTTKQLVVSDLEHRLVQFPYAQPR
jgi:YYY domain-containing protein